MTMNKDTAEKIAMLNEELEGLQNSLAGCREELSKLRQHRRELIEVRRGLHLQRREHREANDTEAVAGIDEEVAGIDREIEMIEEHENAVEGDMEGLEESIGEIVDELAEIESEYAHTGKSGFHAEFGGMDIGESINKAMSKIAEIDFDSIGNNIGRAVDKAVTGINRGFTSAASRVGNNEKGDYYFAGSGAIPEGNYGKLTFSGSGNLNGDITCRSLKASGSVKAGGNIECAGEIKTSGSLNCRGDVSAEVLKTAGSVRIGGGFDGGVFKVAGSVNVGGGIKASEIKTSGSITAGGDCECDTFYSAGRLKISGMLNADDIEIRLDGPDSSVNSIGCGKIVVHRRLISDIFNYLGLKSLGGRLRADVIEGDDIRLENTTAKTVRGKDVHIGYGCEIGRVEFSGKCEVSDNATVGETVRQ